MRQLKNHSSNQLSQAGFDTHKIWTLASKLMLNGIFKISLILASNILRLKIKVESFG